MDMARKLDRDYEGSAFCADGRQHQGHCTDAAEVCLRVPAGHLLQNTLPQRLRGGGGARKCLQSAVLALRGCAAGRAHLCGFPAACNLPGGSLCWLSCHS